MSKAPLPPGAGPEQPEALESSRFLRLIGVFLVGFLLVVGLKAFFSHLQDELGARSMNERARLFIGEEIVRAIQEIEKDVYHMPALASDAAQARKVQEIGEHVKKLEHDLQVLRRFLSINVPADLSFRSPAALRPPLHGSPCVGGRALQGNENPASSVPFISGNRLKAGGTVKRVIDLNMEGHDQMLREVRYQPPADAVGYVMELIEIAPLLGQLDQKIQELRALLGQRSALRERRDMAGFFDLDQGISLFLKHLPPYFLRLNENANRLFFESSEHLARLEEQLARERDRYQFMENLLVVLVIALASVAGLVFARQMRESNHRLRLAWEEMRAAKEESERASRAKSEFVARMSHELRTPMNAILGFSQLQEGEALDAEHLVYVHEINRAGVHLLELINQVLDLSKIEAGGMVLENIPFDLISTLDEVASIVTDRARGRGLALRFFASPELPTRVLGDPTRLRQVLINLVGNAVKFTHDGSIDLRITPVMEGTRIEFSVQDTGIGMEDATLARLFRPFAQADESITRKYGGTGLGLMISRDLVLAMGGDIKVESTPGVGSRFSFSLPARPVPDSPARPLPLAGYRAIMTCTEAHQVEVLGVHLEALGAEIIAAPTPEHLQKALNEEAERPWVFIGRSACLASLEAYRHHQRRDIRLLLTAGQETGTPEGADAVLMEPFTYSRLLGIVQALQKNATDMTAPASAEYAIAAPPPATEPQTPADPHPGRHGRTPLQAGSHGQAGGHDIEMAGDAVGS